MPMPRRAKPAVLAAAVATTALLSCVACSKPEPPDTDRPPEPQATEAAGTLHEPIDRANAVEGQVQDAAAKQRASVDAQAGY